MPPENDAHGNAPPLPSKASDPSYSSSTTANQFNQEDNFGSRPPSYNHSDNNVTKSDHNEKKQQFQSAPSHLDDDLGLPSVPDSYPNDYFKGGNNGGGGTASSNSNKNPNHDPAASIDFDELTKRFNNLKSFK